MIKKIFQTSDGKIFDSEKEASIYESKQEGEKLYSEAEINPDNYKIVDIKIVHISPSQKLISMKVKNIKTGWETIVNTSSNPNIN